MGEIGYLFNLIFTYPIYNGLMLLYHLFNDFGLSIVVLTLIIRLLLFPLNLQQLKSMKANQALQPQMAEIRKKYAKDQQAQGQAMQALYKEYGVNPLSGCLPLLIQLPVLYGLFYALNVVLRNNKLSEINAHLYPFVAPFSKFPDIYLNWFSWIHYINPAWSGVFSLGGTDPSHVLPVLAGLATFIQLRMSQPKTAPGAPTDSMTQSTKTMQYVMPFVTFFFGLSFAAGLALYWTVSSVFQAAQQFFVTGWGSLLVTPNFPNKTDKPAASSNGRTISSKTGSKTYTGDQRREQELQQEAESSNESDSPIASKMRSTPRSSNGNSTQSSRRSRGSSASARRRGGAQRSRR